MISFSASSLDASAKLMGCINVVEQVCPEKKIDGDDFSQG